MSADEVIAIVDGHGADLERKLACEASAAVAEFTDAVERLEVLHARAAEIIAQAAWLSRWPLHTDHADKPASPLSIDVNGQTVEIPDVLSALRTARLPPQITPPATRSKRTGPGEA